MFIPVSDLTKSFATAKLALERLLGNMSPHMIIQLVKVIENHVAFLELAVVKPVVLSADTNTALFKLVNQEFFVGADEPLESSNTRIKIITIENLNLHLICNSVRVFKYEKKLL